MTLQRRLCAVCVLSLLALALAGCRPSFQAGREPAFFAALFRSDLAGAERELVSQSRATWRADTEALLRAHGAMRPGAATGGDSGGVPGFTDHFTLYRIGFADGYERCLWVKGTGASELTLVNGGYVDCATVPAPRVVYSGPATPRTTP
jgi:hypothetical protein